MGTTRTDGTVGDHPDLPHVVPSGRELERAIASVTGVATAEVHRGADGRDRLRISLIAGADPEVVAWSVAATLRERFGIALDPTAITVRPDDDLDDDSDADLDDGPATEPEVTSPDGFRGDPELVAAARAALGRPAPPAAPSAAPTPPVPPAADVRAGSGEADRPRPAPRRASGTPAATPPRAATPTSLNGSTAAPGVVPEPPAVPGPSHRGEGAPRRRAAIAELVARPQGEDLAVLATLRLADREVTGRAQGLSTRRGRWRTIALATLAALGELTDGRLRADVDHVTVLAFPDLAHVTVSVTLLGDHGEERYLGAAMVRDDPDRAVMRATLDAVNRRVEPWLAGQPRPA